MNPANPTSNQPFTITAEITDLNGIHNATLTYDYPGGNSTTLIMSGLGDDFSATLTGIPGNTTLNVTIWAEDDSFSRHTTTYDLQVNVMHVPIPALPPAFLIPVDPTLLALGGLGVGAVALVLGLVFMGQKPKKRRKK
jgi:hypothetical protein